MPYKITPKPFEEHQKLDLPGEHPTHHRVKMPNGGGAIGKEGVVVAALDPHYVRQHQRGEVEIVEGTVDKDGEFTPKPAPAPQPEPAHHEEQ